MAGGLQRVAQEQLALAASALDSPQVDVHDSIHEIRKRCKRLRAALRLVRGGLEDSQVYSEENARYRALAKSLSRYRDTTAQIECLNALIHFYRREVDPTAFHGIRQALRMRRDALTREKEFSRRLQEARAALTAAQRRIPSWTQVRDEFDSLEGGLLTTLQRATHAMQEAKGQPSVRRFHQWRKRVNDHRHHCRLLADVFERHMKARADSLAQLADLLGEEHDLALLEDLLSPEAGLVAEERAIEMLRVLIQARRESLRKEALELGEKLFCENPKGFVRRTEVRYRVWHKARTVEDVQVGTASSHSLRAIQSR